MTKKEVQARLLAVFGDVQHPGNRQILRKDLEFPRAYIVDLEFLFRYEGRPWWEIDKWTLLREESCFSFLSDAGLLYIIPAYLYHAYKEKGVFDTFNYWEDRLLEILAQKGRGDLRFTPEQIHLIDAVFLHHAQEEWVEYGSGASALGNNWSELIAQARAHYHLA